jgi:GT2 family glycosyltransferase
MNTLMIATIRNESEISELINEIKRTATTSLKLVISSSLSSVAINVNRALDAAEGQFIIKVDDDITGFSPGWDAKMIEPFGQDANIGVVSARLLNVDGSVQFTCSRNFNMHPDWEVNNRPLVPFCCVAFRNDGTRMDENYIGSGYDDADYCNQLRVKNASVKFLINNQVRLIHKHEQKNAQLDKNSKYFYDKWSGVDFPDGLGLVS